MKSKVVQIFPFDNRPTRSTQCSITIILYTQKCKAYNCEMTSVFYLIILFLIMKSFRCCYFLIDAFTKDVFRGNPASVFYLKENIEKFYEQQASEWMKKVAQEVNSPVTAFVQEEIECDETQSFHIRWFTPTKELELCGHATIASAHVLYHELNKVHLLSPIKFNTKYQGSISVNESIHRSPTKHNSSNLDDMIELKFPESSLIQRTALTDVEEQVLQSTLSIQKEDILFQGDSEYDRVIQIPFEKFLSLPQTSEINFPLLHQFPTKRGIIITSSPRYPLKHSPISRSVEADFFLRMFLPRYGINEDYVSGSAFSAVARFWLDDLKKQNLIPADCNELLGFQNSTRGGFVRLTWKIDDSNTVRLSGCCRTIIKGEYL